MGRGANSSQQLLLEEIERFALDVGETTDERRQRLDHWLATLSRGLAIPFDSDNEVFEIVMRTPQFHEVATSPELLAQRRQLGLLLASRLLDGSSKEPLHTVQRTMMLATGTGSGTHSLLLFPTSTAPSIHIRIDHRAEKTLCGLELTSDVRDFLHFGITASCDQTYVCQQCRARALNLDPLNYGQALAAAAREPDFLPSWLLRDQAVELATDLCAETLSAQVAKGGDANQIRGALAEAAGRAFALTLANAVIDDDGSLFASALRVIPPLPLGKFRPMVPRDTFDLVRDEHLFLTRIADSWIAAYGSLCADGRETPSADLYASELQRATRNGAADNLAWARVETVARICHRFYPEALDQWQADHRTKTDPITHRVIALHKRLDG